MRPLVQHSLAVSALLLFAVLQDLGAHASSGDAARASFDAMVARDRFGKPSTELDAWEAYKEHAFDKPDTTAAIKARIEMRVGIAFFYTNAYETALSTLARAETLAQAAPALDTAFWAELRAYQALTLTDLKRFDAASAMVLDALDAAKVNPDAALTPAPTWLSALTLNVAGYHAFKAGALEKARDLMCRAAEDARKVLPLSDPLLHLNANNCGVFLYFLDDPRAVDTLEEASTRSLAHLPADHPIVGQALNSTYAVSYRLGRYPEAEALARTHMQLEIQLRSADNNRVYDPASMLSKALAAQGRFEEAAKVQAQVIDLADRMKGAGDFRAGGTARLLLAKLLDQLRRYDRSQPLYLEALQRYEADFSKTHKNYALAQIAYGVHLARTGALDDALRVARDGQQALAKVLGPHHLERLIAELDYAVLSARAGKTRPALKIARDGQSALTDQLKALAQGRAARISTSLVLSRGFTRVVEIALSAQDTGLALEAIQLASASELALATAQMRAQASLKDEGLGVLTERLRSARLAQQDAQQALDEGLLKRDTSQQVAPLAAALRTAKAATQALEAELKQTFPRYGQLGVFEPVSQRDVLRTLGPNKALVIPLESFDRVFTVFVTQEGVSWARSDISPHAVRNAIETVMDVVRRPNSKPDSAGRPAHRVFEAVFPGKSYQALAGQKDFLFLASGPLAKMPPALLAVRANAGRPTWLIEERSGALRSTFQGLDQLDAPSKNTRFVGLGAPALRGKSGKQVKLAQLFRGGIVDASSVEQMPALPGAEAELAAMQSAFTDARSLVVTGKAFTQKRISEIDFSGTAVVAFATHGLTSQEITGLTEPALVLTPTPGAPGEQSLLTASEIAALTMPVDWVILSACNSGQGRTLAAPMYSGLAKAFRLAGAKTLLLSHWPVRDDAAAFLSTRTVKLAQNGANKADALRRAQLALMNDRAIPGSAHPALWAPFVLIAN
ncbi:MAG: CHAT domain-containing protein [Pseudomonadota bacterium]